MNFSIVRPRATVPQVMHLSIKYRQLEKEIYPCNVRMRTNYVSSMIKYWYRPRREKKKNNDLLCELSERIYLTAGQRPTTSQEIFFWCSIPTSPQVGLALANKAS